MDIICIRDLIQIIMLTMIIFIYLLKLTQIHIEVGLHTTSKKLSTICSS